MATIKAVRFELIKGVSCYGAKDAVIEVEITTLNGATPLAPKLVRDRDACDCGKTVYTSCNPNTPEQEGPKVNGTYGFLFADLPAGDYWVEFNPTETLQIAVELTPAAGAFSDLTQRGRAFRIRDGISVDLYAKPASLPYMAKDGAIEGVVKGPLGRYQVGLYVDYRYEESHIQGLPGDLSGNDLERSFANVERWNRGAYTAVYNTYVQVDNTNGGRFAFGALKPGQYTVVTSASLWGDQRAPFFAEDGEFGNNVNRSVWYQSATSTVYVGVDYLRAIFRLLGVVFSIAVLTWLFRHVYSLLIDVLDDLVPNKH